MVAIGRGAFEVKSGSFSFGPRPAYYHPRMYHPRMSLSWNEIRHRAIAFSRECRGETREAAEAKSTAVGTQCNSATYECVAGKTVPLCGGTPDSGASSLYCRGDSGLAPATYRCISHVGRPPWEIHRGPCGKLPKRMGNSPGLGAVSPGGVFRHSFAPLTTTTAYTFNSGRVQRQKPPSVVAGRLRLLLLSGENTRADLGPEPASRSLIGISLSAAGA
jgi:hypothetical protein